MSYKKDCKMYNRNELIYAQKKYNENLAENPEHKPKGVNELDNAIEQIDHLLSLIKSN